MEGLFLKILNMSITAGWLVLAVVLVRALLKKAPKALTCLLWGLVALRLICPFSIESVWSLIPSAETVPGEILYTNEPAIHSGIDSLNAVINPVLEQRLTPQPWNSVNPAQVAVFVAMWVWLAGMLAMAAYALISYWRLRRRVRASLPLEGNIFLCDGIDTPFILGFFKPRIYLPSAMDGEQREYVLAHEQAHLRRRDHWWKHFGFALLAIHWFNPLIWMAYILLCRDIELACDEKVIKTMETAEKKGYSEALLACSMPRRSIAACPLAFGEVGVKQRIRSVLHYKKPAFWLFLLAAVACVAVAVFFLTDPLPEKDLPDSSSRSDLEGLSLVLKDLDLDLTPTVTVDWVNRSGKTVDFGEFFSLQYKDGGEWVDCELNAPRTFITIGYMVDHNRSFEQTYNLCHFDLSAPGTYRISAGCSVVQGSKRDEYAVSLEFWLAEGIKPLYLDPVEQVYSNGSYSFVTDVESQPNYRFFNGFLHSFSGTEWKELGAMYHMKLDQKNFDDLFQNQSEWFSSSPSKLRRNNANAWRLWTGDTLYFLLEQKNGDYFLAIGNEDTIRWVYRLQPGVEEKGNAEPVAQELSPLAKAINEAVLERYGASEKDGYIHSAANVVIHLTTASATPKAAHSGYMDAVTAVVMTRYTAYRVEEDDLFPVETHDEPAFFRFAVDAAGNYTLQEYIYEYKNCLSKLPAELDQELLDPWYYQTELKAACLTQAVETLSGI
ncbi:MAG: hypothetical protein IJ043_02570 [Clostridia bacterium]|nr:hypothetical protein [Clostridia bacterium]